MNSDLAYTVDEACKRSRTSRAFLYQEIAAGKLRAKKRGRRTVILPADLHSWLENLPDLKPTGTPHGGTTPKVTP